MKQIGLAGRTVPSSAAASVLGEGGQPTGKVGPVSILLRSPLVPFPLFWQRGNKMKVLGRLTVKS